jgi:GntR family transcriptional regulator/MocR family aminotransferase
MPTHARSKGLCLRIDAREEATLQAQIYDGVRRAILDGVLAPGSRVPSSRALASDLGVSRTTSLLAYEQLAAEGYLESRRGSGTYVARELPDDLPTVRTTPKAVTRHPPLSRRGMALAAVPAMGLRIPGPPRPFRIGVPALDHFPMSLWASRVARRLRSATLAQLDYTDPSGVPALREAIAEHVSAARGTRCTADQVIVTAGAQRGVDLMCHMLLDPGDEAWLEEPGYAGARSALIAAGVRVLPAPVDGDGVRVDLVARARRRARLIYVTPSHQFPLGVPMSLARRLALLRWASDTRAWILEDDYDSEFRYYGTRPIPCLHGLDGDGCVIYVGTFSKHLMPALRLGFLILPPDLRERALQVRRTTDLHPQTIDQLALADLIGEGHYDRHLRRIRAVYEERLRAFEDAAERHCAGVLRVRPVHTGLHAVADLETADAERVFEEAYARGVEVMPLCAYYADRRKAPNALVLSFASAPPPTLVEGMKKLAAAIEAAGRPQRVRRRA